MTITETKTFKSISLKKDSEIIPQRDENGDIVYDVNNDIVYDTLTAYNAVIAYHISQSGGSLDGSEITKTKGITLDSTQKEMTVQALIDDIETNLSNYI